MPRTCAGDQTRCQFVKLFVTLRHPDTNGSLLRESLIETVLFHKGQSDSFIMFHNFGHVNLKYKKNEILLGNSRNILENFLKSGRRCIT